MVNGFNDDLQTINAFYFFLFFGSETAPFRHQIMAFLINYLHTSVTATANNQSKVL